METIKEWLLSGRNYDIGVILFNTYAQDAALKEMFAQGESPYRLKRLVKELEAISNGQQTITAQPVTKADLPEEQIPEAKDDYRDKWVPLFQELNFLRHKLRDAPDDITRGQMAFKILDIEKKCMYWWDRSDYYTRTGQHMPEDIIPIDVVTDKNALMKRLNNVRPNITKYKKKLATDPGNEKYQEKLKYFEAEKAALESQLGINPLNPANPDEQCNTNASK